MLNRERLVALAERMMLASALPTYLEMKAETLLVSAELVDVLKADRRRVLRHEATDRRQIARRRADLSLVGE